METPATFFGTQLRRGGSVPFFVYAGPTKRDRVQGRIQLPGASGQECTGEAWWCKTARTAGYYASGFQTHLKVTGSRYDAPEGDGPVLDYTDALLQLGIHFSDIDAEALFDAALTAAGPNESSVEVEGPTMARSPRVALKAPISGASATASTPAVKFAVNRKRGTFSGVLRLGPTKSAFKKFRGVILQHQNVGVGFVKLDSGGSGEVVLTPK